MNIFWKKQNLTFKTIYKDNKEVKVHLTYEIKRNFAYYFSERYYIDNCIKDCIKDFFSIFIEKKFMYESENVNRLIDSHKLRLINSHINTSFNLDWCPKHFKVRNINITHLV